MWPRIQHVQICTFSAHTAKLVNQTTANCEEASTNSKQHPWGRLKAFSGKINIKNQPQCQKPQNNFKFINISAPQQPGTAPWGS